MLSLCTVDVKNIQPLHSFMEKMNNSNCCHVGKKCLGCELFSRRYVMSQPERMTSPHLLSTGSSALQFCLLCRKYTFDWYKTHQNQRPSRQKVLNQNILCLVYNQHNSCLHADHGMTNWNWRTIRSSVASDCRTTKASIIFKNLLLCLICSVNVTMASFSVVPSAQLDQTDIFATGFLIPEIWFDTER